MLFAEHQSWVLEAGFGILPCLMMVVLRQLVLLVRHRVLVAYAKRRYNGTFHQIFAKPLHLHCRYAIQHPQWRQVDTVILCASLVAHNKFGLVAILGQLGTTQKEQLLDIVECDGSTERRHVEDLHKTEQFAAIG